MREQVRSTWDGPRGGMGTVKGDWTDEGKGLNNASMMFSVVFDGMVECSWGS